MKNNFLNYNSSISGHAINEKETLLLHETKARFSFLFRTEWHKANKIKAFDLDLCWLYKTFQSSSLEENLTHNRKSCEKPQLNIGLNNNILILLKF